tara:strand:- start:507 stop:677 length:171 start_codon:yes stop_codon:yes gene_type:complete
MQSASESVPTNRLQWPVGSLAWSTLESQHWEAMTPSTPFLSGVLMALESVMQTLAG